MTFLGQVCLQVLKADLEVKDTQVQNADSELKETQIRNTDFEGYVHSKIKSVDKS